MITALILFFGSIFVAIVETLMFHLMDTAKTRSIDIAEVLVGVIDARDPNLNGHSRYVQAVTMLIYRYLPNNLKKDLNPVSLEYAALMHDVGKLGVPESILNKPAKLDEDKWTVMRNHPKTGVKILKPLHTFDDIADTYSAITMRRSNKPPRTHEEAIRIIREVAGTQLDRELAEIFLKIPKEELVRCMPEEVKY